jgi:hypothetical protein
MEIDLKPLAQPQGRGILTSNRDRLNPYPPIERLRGMSHEAYEDFILEWAHGYLSNKDVSGYSNVFRSGGAGDMGRDIVAVMNANVWDNYQCKHYDHALYPGDIWLELGKLCYYTFNKNYTIPRNYFFVAPDGAGGDLHDYIRNPATINDELASQWEKKCANKITGKGEIKLEGKLKDYVQSFDFSILKIAMPLTVIEQHAKTHWHHYRFGLYKKNRPAASSPSATILANELTYVRHLFEVYGEAVQKPILDIEHLSGQQHLVKHFNRQRIYFYSAESLSQFARDISPGTERSFYELKAEILSGVIETCEDQHENGMRRLKATLDKAVDVSINDNILIADLRNDDRKGICHHLANDGELQWVKKNAEGNAGI